MSQLVCNSYIKTCNSRKAISIYAIYNRLFSDKVISLEVNKFDVIDEFTTDLIQEKASKWENYKLRKSFNLTCSLVKPMQPKLPVNNLSQVSLDSHFMGLIQEGNQEVIEGFIKMCQVNDTCPSFSNIISLLEANSRCANINIIQGLKNLFSQDDTSYQINAHFDHYLAEAYWIKGEILKALSLFEVVYDENPSLRRKVRIMLKYLIADLTTHSEAILVSIIKFSEQLFLKYNDAYILTCVWQACFISEWYSDQKLALDLLERNEGLRVAVVGTLPYVVKTSLKHHQVEVVYRLLELLIKYNMKTQYSAILVSLFNYKFYIGDMKSCSEIIQWTVTYNVILPNIIHERFLMLLLKRKNIDDIKPSRAPGPKIELKF